MCHLCDLINHTGLAVHEQIQVFISPNSLEAGRESWLGVVQRAQIFIDDCVLSI